jgi:mono/diheme cytochrome c family protein
MKHSLIQLRCIRRIAWPLTLVYALSALAAWADQPLMTATQQLPNMTGAEIFAHFCQGCHMPEGKGAVGAGHYPQLAGDPALTSWEYVALTVLQGKNGMLPFGLPAETPDDMRGVHLSDVQVADVVNYVRSHFGNKYKDHVTATQIATLPHRR